MASFPDASVSACVTDPPYNLSFMGQKWDTHASPGAFQVWCEGWAREVFRVLKPGGHLLAFGGTRTHHRLACGIEDAGFEMRDTFAWIYGQGMPKSHNVSKAIDKAAGATRPVTGIAQGAGSTNTSSLGPYAHVYQETSAATPEAKHWEGWGTALKPAVETIVVARKAVQGTVAQNVLQFGTGALNIEASRIPHGPEVDLSRVNRQKSLNPLQIGGAKPGDVIQSYKPGGRWPANVVVDEEVADLLGAYAKYFYCAKASRAERKEGTHPTVKPVALMRYLARLVTPPGGIILDPFMGSGTTGVAALLENFSFIGIDSDPQYFEIARKRCALEDSNL